MVSVNVSSKIGAAVRPLLRAWRYG